MNMHGKYYQLGKRLPNTGDSVQDIFTTCASLQVQITPAYGFHVGPRMQKSFVE